MWSKAQLREYLILSILLAELCMWIPIQITQPVVENDPKSPSSCPSQTPISSVRPRKNVAFPNKMQRKMLISAEICDVYVRQMVFLHAP
jgi:hypothetical protein